jgi:hypothetical protein
VVSLIPDHHVVKLGAARVSVVVLRKSQNHTYRIGYIQVRILARLLRLGMLAIGMGGIET